MPKKIIDKLELVKKFLNPDSEAYKKLKKIDDVLDLPLSEFKFLQQNDAELMSRFIEVSKIGDLALIDQDEPFKKLSKAKGIKAELEKKLKEDPDFEDRVKKAVTIGLLARRINKKSLQIEKKDQKIIVAGLNNAGKTAILSKFGGKLGIKDLMTLKPTKGIARQEITTDEINMLIWDFGGQASYRDKYLRAPEKYFIGVHLIIFVIDIQDVDRYDESIEYFEKIIEAVTALEETPYFLVFIHKYDPDLREDEETNLNVELLKDLLKSMFTDKKLDYDVFLSSIYSMIANEPAFSQFIKGMMQQESNYFQPGSTIKIEEVYAIVENALNAIVNLSEMVSQQYKEVTGRLEFLEKLPRTGSHTQTAPSENIPEPIYSSAPPPPPPPPPSANAAPSAQPMTQSVRGAIISELKQMFAKRGNLS